MKKQRLSSRRTAVALRYQKDEDHAPRLTAKGQGKTAEAILQAARENNVPIQENQDLLELLYPLELDQEIPPELYRVVAEVLAYIYRLNQKVDS